MRRKKLYARAKGVYQIMKKTLICILLVISVLTAVTACTKPDGSETETETETSSAAEKNGFPVVSGEERSLIFRYYYMSIWRSICANVENDGYKYGYGENFDPHVSPDEQYFLSKKGGEPILWSDELAILAANDSNRTISLYNDAVNNGDFKLKDEDITSLSIIIEQAKKSAENEGISFEEYLTKYYGYGFTPEFFEKMLTIEQAVYSYSKTLESWFMSKRAEDTDKYEEYSELAAEDLKDYRNELLSTNTQEFFVDDVYCTDGKAAALACIKENIDEHIHSHSH